MAEKLQAVTHREEPKSQDEDSPRRQRKHRGQEQDTQYRHRDAHQMTDQARRIAMSFDPVGHKRRGWEWGTEHDAALT